MVYDLDITLREEIINMTTKTKYNRKSTKAFIKKWLAEGHFLTTDPNKALYIMENGLMLDAEIYYGQRTLDHRQVEYIATGSRYDKYFWLRLHREYRVVRVVPEHGLALIYKGQHLTRMQQRIILKHGLSVERY
jgi:hypothetical protein